MVALLPQVSPQHQAQPCSGPCMLVGSGTREHVFQAMQWVKSLPQTVPPTAVHATQTHNRHATWWQQPVHRQKQQSTLASAARSTQTPHWLERAVSHNPQCIPPIMRSLHQRELCHTHSDQATQATGKEQPGALKARLNHRLQCAASTAKHAHNTRKREVPC